MQSGGAACEERRDFLCNEQHDVVGFVEMDIVRTEGDLDFYFGLDEQDLKWDGKVVSLVYAEDRLLVSGELGCGGKVGSLAN
jgi:hypothetical protein